MMQYKAVAGAVRAWLPCAGGSRLQFARATAGSNLRRTTPGLSMSEAGSVEKQEVGEESGRVPRPAKLEAESVEEQEIGEESGEEEEAERRAPPKEPGTVGKFLVGGMEKTPLAPTPLRRSPSLKHTEGSPPIEPSLQQKRRLHTIDRCVLDELDWTELHLKVQRQGAIRSMTRRMKMNGSTESETIASF